MNKKGEVGGGHGPYWTGGFIWAIISLILIIILLTGGGATAIFKIGSALSKVPSWVLILFGAAILWRIVRGRK